MMDYKENKPCPSFINSRFYKAIAVFFRRLDQIRPVYWLALFLLALIIYAAMLPYRFWFRIYDTFRQHYLPITLLLCLSLLAVSLVWKAGQKIDSAIFHMLNRRKRHILWLDQTMQLITELGNGIATAIIAVILFIYVNDMLAYAFVLGSLVVWLIVELFKVTLGRARPFTKLENVRVVGQKARGKSFPSGHTSQAFYSATMLLQYLDGGILVHIGLYLLAVWIGLTRIYLGMHYPRDVLAGSFLGTLLGIMWLTINGHIMELLGWL